MKKLYSYYTETEFDSKLGAVGIYAHGKLETKLGYDVVCPVINTATEELEDFPEPGIYDVEVVHHDENIPAKLYYWRCNRNRHRGLVVLPEDAENVQDAETKYNNRENHI